MYFMDFSLSLDVALDFDALYVHCFYHIAAAHRCCIYIAIKATGIQTCHNLYEPYPYSVQEIPSSPPLQNNIYSPFSICIDLSQLQTVPLPFDCPAILFVDDPSRD
jgi:hypothetical protein